MTQPIPAFESLNKDLAQSAPPLAFSLRNLIFETAHELGHSVEESLKWGQPSYKTPLGSPVRIGWSESSVSLFVNCNTQLIDTFVERFDSLRVVGSREVVFGLDEPLPEAALRECLALAFLYHSPQAKKERGPGRAP